MKQDNYEFIADYIYVSIGDKLVGVYCPYVGFYVISHSDAKGEPDEAADQGHGTER